MTATDEYSPGFSKTDACFIELNAIGYRITGAVNLLVEHGNKLPLTTVEALVHKDLPKDKFIVKSMWDYLVLNLYKLIEIHDSILGKILRDNQEIELEKCLEPSWKAIKEIESKIKDYRNLIAHSKELANNYESFMDLDPNYYQTQTKIIVAAYAAIFYISGIFENLPDLYKTSRIPFEAKIAKIKSWPPSEEIGNALVTTNKVLELTNVNLTKGGYTKTHNMNYD